MKGNMLKKETKILSVSVVKAPYSHICGDGRGGGYYKSDNKNNDNEKQNHRKKICICDGMRHNKNHSPGAGGFSLHEN